MSKRARFVPDADTSEIPLELKVYIGQVVESAVDLILDELEPRTLALEKEIAPRKMARRRRWETLKWLLPMAVSLAAALMRFL